MGIRYVTVNEQGNEVTEDEEVQGHECGTNNEMELLACIKGLEGAIDHRAYDAAERVCVYTDSMYVTSNVNRALFEWSKLGWHNRDGKPVENAELWRRLFQLRKKIRKPVDFKWVKGHAKDPHNKAVDKLAKQSAKGVLGRPLKVTAVRKKKSTAIVQRGCVPMRGQTMLIRIITDTYMRVQKIYKYKYEVLAESEEHAGKLDLIFHETDDPLRAGHHYEVRVNSETKNPRIIELIRELER